MFCFLAKLDISYRKKRVKSGHANRHNVNTVLWERSSLRRPEGLVLGMQPPAHPVLVNVPRGKNNGRCVRFTERNDRGQPRMTSLLMGKAVLLHQLGETQWKTPSLKVTDDSRSSNDSVVNGDQVLACPDVNETSFMEMEESVFKEQK